MNNAIKTQNRLKEILGTAGKRPVSIEQVIKSDVMNVLRNYFTLNENDIVLKIDGENDIFVVRMVAHARNIKALNYLK